MTLGELLDILRVSILNDRSNNTGATSDYLWTDATLVVYINEAQRRLASKALLLRDGTTDEVTKITLVEGQSEYVLHESVLCVLSAKVVGQHADLTRAGHGVLSTYTAPTESWIDPASFSQLPPGSPVAYSTDEGLQAYDSDNFSQITLRVHPVPSAAVDGTVVRLRVCRKPLDKFTVDALGVEPEVPEDYHLDMLDWAAYLALRVVDDDAGSAKRALEFRASFDQTVKEARAEVMRKIFVPMDWGFGRGGFTWSN